MVNFVVLWMLASSLILPSSRASVLSCVDIPTCNLLPLIHTSETVELLFTSTGDPHHFAPTGQQVRALLTSANLFLPPLELAPWAKNLDSKRSPLTTKMLKFSAGQAGPWAEDFAKFGHDLAHYWDYPPLHCAAWTELGGRGSMCPFARQMQDIEWFHKNPPTKKYLVVITHEAIGPLLRYMGLPFISLRSSAHGAGVSAQALEQLAQAVNDNKKNGTVPTRLLGIVENEIQLPAPAREQLLATGADILKWNHLGKKGDDPSKALDVLLIWLKQEIAK